MSYPSWEETRDSFFTRKREFTMLRGDEPTFMSRPHAVNAGDLKGADVVILGAPYVAGWEEYAGLPKSEWLAAPKRVRQQSVRYRSGYVQDLDIDVFEHLKVVDYGDAAIPAEVIAQPTAANVLRAQAAVEEKVNDVLEAGAIPIVIGQNSPCGSYAIAKPIAERQSGSVGCVSLDTHWDIGPVDDLTMDPRVAGAVNWKRFLYTSQPNFSYRHLVEIGERGMHEDPAAVREFLRKGAHFYPVWKVRRDLGIDGLCRELDHAYNGSDSVYVHFDMDVIGGAGPAPGDILGELAEPIGMTDYEVIRLAHEIGLRGLTGMSFICIPPGSAVVYRTVVYVVMYLLAGLVARRGSDRRI